MMKIEFVYGVEWLAQTKGDVCRVNYPEWAKLSKRERVGVLAHEYAHMAMLTEQHETGEIDWFAGQSDVPETPDPVHGGECPMCGNAETCQSCGGPWPKPQLSVEEQLRKERAELQTELAMLAMDHTQLRVAVQALIDRYYTTATYEIACPAEEIQKLEQLMEK